MFLALLCSLQPPTPAGIFRERRLVLGAGELGMPVLRNLARRAKNVEGARISVLLRASAVASDEPT